MTATPQPVAAASVPPRTKGKPSVRGKRRRFDLRRDGIKIMGIFLGLILLNILFWVGFVRPQEAAISKLEELKRTSDLQQEDARRALQDLRNVHTHAGEVQAGVGQFYDTMLSTKRERMVPFQRVLTSIGKEFRVRPERVTVGNSDLPQEGLEVMAFNFPLSGAYGNLREFLARLEQQEQFLLVREVSLAGANEGGQTLQLNIGLETYFNAPELRAELEARKADKLKKLDKIRRAARRGGNKK